MRIKQFYNRNKKSLVNQYLDNPQIDVDFNFLSKLFSIRIALFTTASKFLNKQKRRLNSTQKLKDTITTITLLQPCYQTWYGAFQDRLEEERNQRKIFKVRIKGFFYNWQDKSTGRHAALKYCYLKWVKFIKQSRKAKKKDIIADQFYNKIQKRKCIERLKINIRTNKVLNTFQQVLMKTSTVKFFLYTLNNIIEQNTQVERIDDVLQFSHYINEKQESKTLQINKIEVNSMPEYQKFIYKFKFLTKLKKNRSLRRQYCQLALYNYGFLNMFRMKACIRMWLEHIKYQKQLNDTQKFLLNRKQMETNEVESNINIYVNEQMFDKVNQNHMYRIAQMGNNYSQIQKNLMTCNSYLKKLVYFVNQLSIRQMEKLIEDGEKLTQKRIINEQFLFVLYNSQHHQFQIDNQEYKDKRDKIIFFFQKIIDRMQPQQILSIFSYINQQYQGTLFNCNYDNNIKPKCSITFSIQQFKQQCFRTNNAYTPCVNNMIVPRIHQILSNVQLTIDLETMEQIMKQFLNQSMNSFQQNINFQKKTPKVTTNLTQIEKLQIQALINRNKIIISQDQLHQIELHYCQIKQVSNYNFTKFIDDTFPTILKYQLEKEFEMDIIYKQIKVNYIHRIPVEQLYSSTKELQLQFQENFIKPDVEKVQEVQIKTVKNNLNSLLFKRQIRRSDSVVNDMINLNQSEKSSNESFELSKQQSMLSSFIANESKLKSMKLVHSVKGSSMVYENEDLFDIPELTAKKDKKDKKDLNDKQDKGVKKGKIKKISLKKKKEQKDQSNSDDEFSDVITINDKKVSKASKNLLNILSGKNQTFNLLENQISSSQKQARLTQSLELIDTDQKLLYEDQIISQANLIETENKLISQQKEPQKLNKQIIQQFDNNGNILIKDNEQNLKIMQDKKINANTTENITKTQQIENPSTFLTQQNEQSQNDKLSSEQELGKTKSFQQKLLHKTNNSMVEKSENCDENAQTGQHNSLSQQEQDNQLIEEKILDDESLLDDGTNQSEQKLIQQNMVEQLNNIDNDNANQLYSEGEMYQINQIKEQLRYSSNMSQKQKKSLFQELEETIKLIKEKERQFKQRKINEITKLKLYNERTTQEQVKLIMAQKELEGLEHQQQLNEYKNLTNQNIKLKLPTQIEQTEQIQPFDIKIQLSEFIEMFLNELQKSDDKSPIFYKYYEYVKFLTTELKKIVENENDYTNQSLDILNPVTWHCYQLLESIVNNLATDRNKIVQQLLSKFFSDRKIQFKYNNEKFKEQQEFFNYKKYFVDQVTQLFINSNIVDIIKNGFPKMNELINQKFNIAQIKQNQEQEIIQQKYLNTLDNKSRQDKLKQQHQMIQNEQLFSDSEEIQSGQEDGDQNTINQQMMKQLKQYQLQKFINNLYESRPQIIERDNYNLVQIGQQSKKQQINDYTKQKYFYQLKNIKKKLEESQQKNDQFERQQREQQFQKIQITLNKYCEEEDKEKVQQIYDNIEKSIIRNNLLRVKLRVQGKSLKFNMKSEDRSVPITRQSVRNAGFTWRLQTRLNFYRSTSPTDSNITDSLRIMAMNENDVPIQFANKNNTLLINQLEKNNKLIRQDFRIQIRNYVNEDQLFQQDDFNPSQIQLIPESPRVNTIAFRGRSPTSRCRIVSIYGSKQQNSSFDFANMMQITQLDVKRYKKQTTITKKPPRALSNLHKNK